MTTNLDYCPLSTHWPVRSIWARAVLNRIENDRCLEKIDRQRWYRLSNKNRLHADYRHVIHEFNLDDETHAFIKQSEEKSDNIPMQIIQSVLTSLLTLFITRTSGTID
jgi:hypothetical protein